MAASPTNSMYLDILRYSSDVFALDKLRDIRCFTEYKNAPEKSIDVNSLVKYVVLLYSKDSILNRKPMLQLTERRAKASTLADLNAEDQDVKDLVFGLYSKRIRDLIVDYLIHQNQLLWSERCIIEAQIQENQRIRLKPIQKKTSSKPKSRRKKDEQEEQEEEPEDQGSDDKYVIESSDKKSSLTDHFTKYYELLKRYDLEIFTDNEDVKEAAGKRERRSLESIAT